MDQWLVVRSALASRQPGFRFREQAVYAWIPSLTSVSRQATFADKAPIFFPNSIQTTDKEPALWAQFWADQGFTPNEVVYIKGLGDGSLESVSEALSHPKARVAGLVVDKVDKIMHGMEMGIAGMHNQVCQWAKQPYLNMLLDLLLDRGFRVYLTSDHGNVEAEGCGRPAEGAVADLRGERVRIYPDAAHVQRRVREQYGERETVSRAARRVLRSYLDWGVLQETGIKGIYTAGTTLAVDDSRLIAWIVEASLHARANGSAPLKDLIDSPSLFPFRIKPIHAESLVASSSRLDILRLGLDDDLVMLKERPAKGGGK